MYIKQVIIQGFKSYRDRTEVEPFDPGHNVVVGRNGSGKSNFFAAVQFVLSDEYTHLRTEQRQSLLHEGVGPRVVSAYVEIIFDNTDGRLPIEKSEVRLRRIIGSKKDNYILNKMTISRSDLMNLLESAGFSRSNPYYIVKQGEINQMTTATDTARLQLLREIAGTKVYDERTEESKVILNETRVMLEKTAEILQTIVERLQALNEEKEELKEHQRWDKQRRCLEYTIYQRELKETKRKLADMEESSANSLADQQMLAKLSHNAQERISETTKRWNVATDEVAMIKQEQNMQREELQQLIQKSTKLSLTVKDLREEIKNNEEGRKNAEIELEDLQRRIDEKVKELEAINPEYEKLLKDEEELTRNLTIKEQQRRKLYAKRGRGIQFKNKEARDEWIREQLAQLAKQIQDKKAHCQEIQESLANDRETHKSLQNKINTLRGEVGEQKKSIENYEERRYKEIEEKERAQTILKELYRQESTLEAKLASEKENLIQAEQNLRFVAGKQILNGKESIGKVLNTVRESSGSPREVDGYCGLLIDNFSCDKGVYTAVEVIAGKRLFHHIVKNDMFGTKILKEMNRQGLPGEVTFMPLNRLKVNTPKYPDSDDVIPMINKLVYDEKYDKAMRFVFGKTLICRNLEVATKYARENGLECVTTEGDLVSSKGFLTGGYYNRDRTPLGDYQTRTSILKKVSDLENQLTTLKTEIGKIVQTVSSQISKIQKIDVLIRKSKDTYEAMEADIRATKEELSGIERSRTPKEKSLAQCMSNLDEMNVTKEGWEQELNQDLTSQLSPSEHELLNTLNEEIRSLTKESKIIFERRLKSETIKTKLDNLLTNNLMRRRDELTEILQKASGREEQRQLESYLTQLANIKERRESIENEIKAQSEKLTRAMRMLQVESEELEKWKMVKKDAQEKFQENCKSLEKFTSKKNIYEQKIAELIAKIAALGTLPKPETYEKFAAMPNKELFKELEKTNNQLKRYSHVNQKALDQFISFRDQKEKLVKRKEELDRGLEKIQELMNTLEQQKYEAIQFTFKQVSKYFSEVFQKLVPSGHATIVMKTVNGGNNDEEDSEAAETDNFVGVGIRVSFSGSVTESRDMNQLSGGQKSLVALALIFAIQKCDPAPFYLFDEIDQALDAQHREAVAAMIHELSSNAQFITTTFKPEMLRQANKFYGVKYGGKVSRIDCVTREEAANFLENDANDAQ